MTQPSQLPRRQYGLTAPGLLFVLMVVGFVATAAVKVGPAYLDNQKVKQGLQSLKEQYAGKDLQDISDKFILASMNKIISVNLLGPEASKSIAIRRIKGDVIVSANYEVRNNFMSNIDVVIVFENEVNLAE